MKERNKPRLCLIEHTIFPSDILIAVSTREELIKYIEQNKKYKLSEYEIEKLEIKGRGKCTILEGGQIIISLKKQKTNIGIDVVDLTHEIEHAVFLIFERIGIKHTNDSDEVFAYYSSYIMEQALNYFDK